MQDLNDLYYFSQVVEQGGFSAAARALEHPEIPPVAPDLAPEESLGVRLLQRTTRRLRLTSAGERYLHYCREMAASARAADEAMRQLQSEPSGPVIVSCPVSIAQDVLAPLQPEFLDAWPAISVQLLVTNRRVDLIREGVDLALRVRTKLIRTPSWWCAISARRAARLVASPGICSATACPIRPRTWPPTPR